MMKIYYIVDNVNPRHGGGRYAGDLISAIKNTGCEVVVLEQKSKRLGGLILDAIKIRKHLKNCDIVHAIDGYPYAIVAAVANIGLNKKLIITVQGTYAVAPLYNFVAGTLLKWAYKRADKIIAISQYTQNEILKKANLSNIEVINPGIDFKKFYKIPVYSDEKFILSVGALKYRKGYHISIPAFALAKKELPDLKYKIVGSQKDVAYFKHLKDLAFENGVAGDVEFLSGVSDEALSDLYRRAKLFILTSVEENHHFEGFGIVYLEAAASGLPIVATSNSGASSAVKDGYNGLLVHQNDLRATTDAVLKILEDSEFKTKLGNNSREWVKEFSWEKIITDYNKIYSNLQK